jgi:prophage DNA circulation protein
VLRGHHDRRDIDMNDKTEPRPTAADSAHRELISWRDVAQAIDEMVAGTTRTLDVFDQSLALQDWGSRARCDALNAAMTDRNVRIRILLVNAQHATAELPRLTQLLKTQGHRLLIMSTSERSIPAANFVVADRQQLLLRPNSVHSRGFVDFNNPYKSRSYSESFEVLWQLGGDRVFPEAFGL